MQIDLIVKLYDNGEIDNEEAEYYNNRLMMNFEEDEEVIETNWGDLFEA